MTGPSAEEIFSDCSTLWEYGAKDMPRYAQMYADAATKLVESTIDQQKYAYDRPAFDKWIEMRDLVQERLLKVTADRLIEVGDAICEIALNYSEADNTNAHDMLLEHIEYAEDPNNTDVDSPHDPVSNPPKASDHSPPPTYADEDGDKIGAPDEIEYLYEEDMRTTVNENN